MKKKNGTKKGTGKSGKAVRRPLMLAAALPLLAVPRLTPVPVATKMADGLYHDLHLEGTLDAKVFAAAIRSALTHGLQAHRLAIADMTQPSTSRRLFVIDMDTKQVVLRTWVAHGQNSGDLMATRFSNRDESHETSLGLYRVGAQIKSPKHGPALLLDGLDKGLNDKALAREVIIHGAEYVGAPFIESHGRLGRSWGCPAVPVSDMARMIELLADGGLLYVYGA